MLFSKKLGLGLIILAALPLVACSTMGKNKDDMGAAEVVDASAANSEGATTSGIGSDTNFSAEGQGTVGAMQVGNQTYYFDFDKSFVRDSDKPSIEVQARYLVANPQVKIRLEGNTDPRGSREYNIALGENRALSVANLLKSHGVSKEQIEIVSYGAEKLAVTGTTEEDYQLDRRTNLVYKNKGKVE